MTFFCSDGSGEVKNFWTVDQQHIHEIGCGSELGQVLGEELDNLDFPLILEEVKQGEKDWKFKKSEIPANDKLPSPTLTRDQPFVSTSCQSPFSLPPANVNHGLGNGITESAFLGNAEGDSLMSVYCDDLHEQVTNGDLQAKEVKDDECPELIDIKTTHSEPSLPPNHSDDFIDARKEEVVGVSRKPELIPVIKLERCDNILGASDCHKLTTGTNEVVNNSNCRKRGRPKDIESLWKDCQQKIKKARIEKANSKVAVVPPISELEQYDYYEKKELYQMKFEKKQEILKNDGKKEHSIENLLFLKNMERRFVTRRKERKVPTPKVECQLCHEALSRKKFEHAFLIHGIEYRNTCPVCLEKNLTDLKAHFRTTHFNDIPLSCHLCSTVCYSGKELRKHVVCHKTVDPLTCAVCKFDFASEEELEAHRTQHNVTNREVKVKREKNLKLLNPPMLLEGTCEICGHSFRGPSELELKKRIQLHKKKLHTEKLKCPMCDRMFSLYTRLSRHCLSAHTPEDQRPFICPFENCGKGFKTSYNLKSHQRYHKPPQYKCEKCDKQFYWPHVWRHHKCPST